MTASFRILSHLSYTIVFFPQSELYNFCNLNRVFKYPHNQLMSHYPTTFIVNSCLLKSFDPDTVERDCLSSADREER